MFKAEESSVKLLLSKSENVTDIIAKLKLDMKEELHRNTSVNRNIFYSNLERRHAGFKEILEVVIKKI